MATVISIINLKGGVGKTTTTVALAEFLTSLHHYRVLVVDLDPQTNATLALIGEHVWMDQNLRSQTVLQVFRDRQTGLHIFDPDRAIVHSASNIGEGIPGLDLLPSSTGLIDLQDDLTLLPSSRVFSSRPVTILGEALADIAGMYDYILIDCPPNLGLITQNGLVMSDYYMIPVVPDTMSTFGIPQIIEQVDRLKRHSILNIEALGIVVTKYRVQSSLHNNILHVLKLQAEQGRYPRVFDTVIPESTRAALAADFTLKHKSLHEKYSYESPYKQYASLTEEVLACART